MTDGELSRLFLALALLLTLAHALGWLFHALKLPRVVGEISAGLVLGQSGLGSLLPSTHARLFSAFGEEARLLSLFYGLGLVMLMLVSGFEVDKTLDRRDRRLVAAVLLGSTVVPCLAIWLAFPILDFARHVGEAGNVLAFQLTLAIAAAVTSIPVISKIFIDLDIMKSRFATVVLTIAALHDMILWIVLGIATGIADEAGRSPAGMAWAASLTILAFLSALRIPPAALSALNGSAANLVARASHHGYVLVVCFLVSAVASLAGVSLVFGALLAGLVVGSMPGERLEEVRGDIKAVAMGFFVPIYFAVVGMRLDLVHHLDAVLCLTFIAVSTAGQLAGTGLAARRVGLDAWSSLNLAIAMNTRGGPGIVLASVAFDYRIIDETMFVTLVLAAIVTSAASGFWFHEVTARRWALMRA